MAFTASNPNYQYLRCTTGTYTNTSGSTGGDIDTGLNTVLFFNTNNNTQAATTNQISISRGVVTLTTVADEDGQWAAFGF